MVHKALKLLILLTLFFTFLIPQTANQAKADGEARLTVSTEIGFDNRIKRQQGFPIEVTLINNGPDISGELVISVSPGWNANQGNIITAVDIPANSERAVTLSLPGHGDMHNYGQSQNIQHIFFYEGTWQNGKAVSLAGDTRMTPRMYNDEERLIGLFTNTPDAYNFLKTVQIQHGNAYTPVAIAPEKVPNDAIGLEMFEMMIIDQVSLSDLSSSQEEAIQAWISRGGKLVVGGDLGLDQKLGSLAELLPMSANLQSQSTSADFFNKEDQREYPTGTIELITGTLADNAKVTQRANNNLPVIASRPFGLGEVVQLGFSPSAQTFASWDGAASYWTEVVQPGLRQQTIRYESVYDQLNWGVSRTTSYFPSSFLPFSVLVTVFIAYILIVFPALYFILRKFDKREHSWWILPALSLLVCLGIFGFGGKDRIAHPQMNEVTLLAIDEQGFGQGYGSLSLLSNRSGHYTIQIGEESFAPFPMNTGFSMDRSVANAGVRHQGDQLDVLFKDVEYWSIRNVSGPISSIEIGTLDADLQIADKLVTGTLVNNTGLDFSELLLMSGRQEVSLGSVGAGETLEINFELNGSILTAPAWRNHSPYNPTADLDERRKDELLRSLHDLNMFTRGKPAIIGFTDTELLQTSLDGKNALVDRYNLIIQSIDISDTLGGPFTISTEDMTPYVYMTDGHGYVDSYDLDRGGSTVFASAGTFEFGFSVPDEFVAEKTTYTELEIKVRNLESIDYEIYNQLDDSYDAIEDATTTFSDPIKYVGEYGHIVIRVRKGEMPEQLPVPQVVLKGEFDQ